MAFDWRKQDDQTIEYHFNPRLTIPDALKILEELPAISALARDRLEGRLDIRYGDRPKETFDLFPAARATAGLLPPVLIFIHGGYWRMMDKSDHSHVATEMVKAGISHISLNYDLCPEVSLDDIVDEIRTAIIYIFKNASTLGIDENRIFISGHSAGGHLTGMMLKEDWTSHGLPGDLIKGAVALSPIFEPEVVMHTSINEDVRLTLDTAKRNNVLSGPLIFDGPVIAAVGELEPEGFRRQSEKFVELCQSAGMTAEYFEISGCHHFTALDAFVDPNHELYKKLLSMVLEY